MLALCERAVSVKSARESIGSLCVSAFSIEMRGLAVTTTRGNLFSLIDMDNRLNGDYIMARDCAINSF